MPKASQMVNQDNRQLSLEWSGRRQGESGLAYLKRIRPFGQSPARKPRKRVGAQFEAAINNKADKELSELAEAEYKLRQAIGSR